MPHVWRNVRVVHVHGGVGMSEPIRDVEAAVRELGALPVPVGPEPQPLSGPICSQAQARAAGLDIAPSVAELDAMAETIVAAGDPLSAEVSLAQAVPLLGAAVTRLRDRVAELEVVVTAERARHTQYADSPHCQTDGEFWPCPFVAAVDGLRRPVAQAAPSAAEVDRCHEALEFDHECRVCRPSLEDPHDGPLTHQYRVGRDLSETGGAK